MGSEAAAAEAGSFSLWPFPGVRREAREDAGQGRRRPDLLAQDQASKAQGENLLDSYCSHPGTRGAGVAGGRSRGGCAKESDLGCALRAELTG